ncbi:PA2779 family protein [Ectothiorhodospiraceae bacterium 2226]|nr:PA2779 family protein [Ectothiorhodospiraceae bacterium 2226]
MLIFPLVIAFLLTGLASQTAMAGIVGTDTVLSDQAAAGERARLEALLDREEVQEKLVEYGVAPAEAAERVAALTDEEVLEIAQNIDELPAGGSVTLLLLVIILILLLR